MRLISQRVISEQVLRGMKKAVPLMIQVAVSLILRRSSSVG